MFNSNCGLSAADVAAVPEIVPSLVLEWAMMIGTGIRTTIRNSPGSIMNTNARNVIIQNQNLPLISSGWMSTR